MAAIKDLRFVVKALKTMSTRWEEIGMTADVIDLDQIKKEYRGTFFQKIWPIQVNFGNVVVPSF